MSLPRTVLRTSLRNLRTATPLSAPRLVPVLPYLAAAPSSSLLSIPAAPPRALHTTAPRPSQAGWSSKGEVKYSELKPITSSPSGEITLIDVREPSEVQEGIIPSAVNVPLSTFKDAFKTDRQADDFQRRFAFARPAYDDKIVVYCRSGKRSQQALEHLNKHGWNNVRNYTGSYLDWVQQEQQNKGQDDD
ncbi:uncharacterized protein PFL1_01403 [Pseudozyma flocculosa PF-1]|uniref:Rhodanese domain-containing protein n=1 Tax=Pseudozyma flocculosa TaxID=84751 RepID=A0A5C3EYS2_9BASI|nr:uncharacterized protein PFL1_01403 [Pseudozyma flocculosa PF-1]EPQ31216.1 hypothetical protein PFL1_01403 [Pseudozyma flocculosa PF-1]SPO36289.1 uncharacterized protein PSFLO_01760 [Pseudozyma flocculosa]